MKELQFQLGQENLRASVILTQVKCPSPGVYLGESRDLVLMSYPPSLLSEGLGWMGEPPKQLGTGEEH